VHYIFLLFLFVLENHFMSIYRTNYDTSACSGFPFKRTEDELEKALRLNAFQTKKVLLNEHSEPVTLHLLEGGNSFADVIPFFNHPFAIKSVNKNEAGEYTLEFVVDLRNFGKWYSPNQQFIVRNKPEFSWNVKRALLNHVWLTQRPAILRDISVIPAAVYASLISEAVSKRFALDAGEQAIIAVLAAFFYYGLFTDDVEYDEVETNKIVGAIARATMLPASKVFDIVDGLKVMDSLENFCTVCQEKTGSIALSSFGIGILIAITSGNWFGTNARENLATALEHPPTWIMIVAASLDETTFKRSVLSKISTRYDKKGAADNFIKSINVLLGGPKLIDEQIIAAE
jgi:hypothetical protein